MNGEYEGDRGNEVWYRKRKEVIGMVFIHAQRRETCFLEGKQKVYSSPKQPEGEWTLNQHVRKLQYAQGFKKKKI